MERSNWPGKFNGRERVRVGRRFGFVALLDNSADVVANANKGLVPIYFDGVGRVGWVGHTCIFHVEPGQGRPMDSQIMVRVPYERSPGLSSRIRRAMQKHPNMKKEEYVTLALEEKLERDGIAPIEPKPAKV